MQHKVYLDMKAFDEFFEEQDEESFREELPKDEDDWEE